MLIFDLAPTGLKVDLSADAFPTRVWSVYKDELAFDGNSTLYLIPTGYAHIHREGLSHVLNAGFFACVPANRGTIIRANEPCLIIERIGYHGMYQLGGPLEDTGRLKYIDGCSDTILVSPLKKGDPALNHLHIPPDVHQTYHEHPSSRIGTIVSGTGYCLTPDPTATHIHPNPLEPDAAKRQIDRDECRGWIYHHLEGGKGWYIPTGEIHSFHTTPASSLEVTAWHPETDYGPTDDAHPMLNRTMINELDASQFDAIRTK